MTYLSFKYAGLGYLFNKRKVFIALCLLNVLDTGREGKYYEECMLIIS